VIYSVSQLLSDLVVRLISEHPTLNGLYQVTSLPISKHELLCQLRDAYQLDVTIQPYDNEGSDRSMVGEKFIRATGYCYPTWRELIDQLVTDPTPYGSWRS
jgi:dTDP-4-dehydrorhamnose reductase